MHEGKLYDANSMLRIGLRVFYNSEWMGGVNYVLGIARMLSRLPADEKPFVVFLVSNAAAQEWAEDNRNLVDSIAPFADAGSLALDLVYPATQIAEIPLGAPWMGWIPDWQCQHLPEMFSAQETTRRRLQYEFLACCSAVCVLSSDQAQEDTLRLFPKMANRMKVLPFPANLPDWVFANTNTQRWQNLQERLQLPERYFVVCNQFWRHKNHLLVLQALQLLDGDCKVHLVFTGENSDTRWPDYSQEVDRLIAASSRVTVTGRLQRDDQLELLRHSQAAIQPSLFEGWSSFVEEARGLGLPILLSDIPVHLQQNPPLAEFFDPTDASALAALLAHWALSPPLGHRASARTNYEHHSSQCARVFLEIAESLRDTWPQRGLTAVEHVVDRVTRYRERIGETIEQSDFDRYCAGVRQMFVTQPEHLSRLATAASTLADTDRELLNKMVIEPVKSKFNATQLEGFERAARVTAASPDKLGLWQRGVRSLRAFAQRRT